MLKRGMRDTPNNLTDKDFEEFANYT